MKALSRTIKEAEDNGLIKGIKIVHQAPSVSHLLFADNCLLFCKVSENTCHNLVKLFRDFGLASGKLINLEKSGVFFSPKTKHSIRYGVKDILGVTSIPLKDKYLGSPLFTNKSKITCFEPLVKKMKTRMLSCKGTDLNTTGKTVVVKNVTSPLYVYQMNCFKILVKICKDITKNQKDYWWGKK